MYNQLASSKWKLSAFAMMLLLLSVNVINQLPFDNILTNIELVEENNDGGEDDCLVSETAISLANNQYIRGIYASACTKAYYPTPYHSIVYPPPEFLIIV